jgi:hypothetical protein
MSGNASAGSTPAFLEINRYTRLSVFLGEWRISDLRTGIKYRKYYSNVMESVLPELINVWYQYHL